MVHALGSVVQHLKPITEHFPELQLVVGTESPDVHLIHDALDDIPLMLDPILTSTLVRTNIDREDNFL